MVWEFHAPQAYGALFLIRTVLHEERELLSSSLMSFSIPETAPGDCYLSNWGNLTSNDGLHVKFPRWANRLAAHRDHFKSGILLSCCGSDLNCVCVHLGSLELPYLPYLLI